jgi:predicted SAM-dependent methyltransferase
MAGIEKIQFSPRRIIPDALVVWHEPGAEVDMVMDLRKPTFADGLVKKLYAFHVLEHLFRHEVVDVLERWKAMLAPGGKLFLVDDDFDFLCRSAVGGDMTAEQWSDQFAHPTYFTKDSTISVVREAGFDLDKTVFWYVDVPDEFPKREYELVTVIDV